MQFCLCFLGLILELIDYTNKMITSNVTIDIQLMLIRSTIDMSLTVLTIVDTVFFQHYKIA